MTSMTESPQPFAASPGLEPLRVKRTWVIALGIVYVVAGLGALGGVVMATIAICLCSRHHDVDRRHRRGVPHLSDQDCDSAPWCVLREDALQGTAVHLEPACRL